MTANSLVNANCKALNCDSSSSRSFADGQEAGSKTVTLVSVMNVKSLIIVKEVVKVTVVRVFHVRVLSE